MWWSSCWRRQPSTRVRRRGRWAMMKNLKRWVSSREYHFPKTLLTLPQCRITEDDGCRDLLSWSWMHVDEQDKVALVVQQQRRWKPRCVGGSWLFVVSSSVVATRIYKEDPRWVTASHNWLGLSLSKCIRHWLIEKINGKRRPRTREALGRILMDYSCTRRAPAPIAMPHLAQPSLARWGKRVCVSPFLLSSTPLQVHRDQPTF
jgi:hypothetical protein